MSFNHRVDKKTIDTQFAKVLRCSYLIDTFDEIITDSLKYFLYDLNYVLHDNNYTEFGALLKAPQILEKNSTYLLCVIGSNTHLPGIGPYQFFLEEGEIVEKLVCNIGDSIEVHTDKDNDLLVDCTSNTAYIGFKVKKSLKSDDRPNIGSLRWLVSKPSWTNHLSSLDDG